MGMGRRRRRLARVRGMGGIMGAPFGSGRSRLSGSVSFLTRCGTRCEGITGDGGV